MKIEVTHVVTPRRSQRIQKVVETPKSKSAVRGPRMMMKLNKSKQDLNKTESDLPKDVPEIIITRPSTGNTTQPNALLLEVNIISNFSVWKIK